MTNSVDRPDQAGEHPGSPRGDTTRQAIVEATVALIGEVGWAGVTTRMVARRAGVTQGVIHYHFGSKDALLRAAVVTAFAGMFTGPMTALTSAETINDGLAAVVASLDALGDQHLLRVGAETLSLALRDPQLGEWMRVALVEFRGVIADGLREATPPRQRDEARIQGTAVLLTAMLDGLLYHRAVDPALDLAAAAAALTTLIRNGGNQ
jgi:AcrR family transcriptional regulator